MIEARGAITVRFATVKEARDAQAALMPENDDHLEARVDGETLVLLLPMRRLASTLNTMDDALACLTAITDAAASSSRPPDDRIK